MKDIITSYLNNSNKRENSIKQLANKYKKLSTKQKAITTLWIILWISSVSYGSFKLTQYLTKTTAKAKEQGKLSARKNYM